MITVPLAKKNAEGKPVFPHSIDSIIDTADPTPLVRNALTAQRDENVVIVLSGPATGLVSIMNLPGGKELITRKVRMLIFAGGSYPTGKPDAQISGDIAAAKRLFAEWPTPIVAVGSEVSEQIAFPAASIDADFAWSPAHPIVEAVRAAENPLKDIPALSPSAALFAVRSDKGLFQRSAPGTIVVDDSGSTRFTPAASGKHTYLSVDPAQRELIVKSLVELASAKPVVRLPRRRPNQVKPDPPKPEQLNSPPAATPKPPSTVQP
jgi:hypothetical protein